MGPTESPTQCTPTARRLRHDEVDQSSPADAPTAPSILGRSPMWTTPPLTPTPSRHGT
jgi:hypothetical protein